MEVATSIFFVTHKNVKNCEYARENAKKENNYEYANENTKKKPRIHPCKPEKNPANTLMKTRKTTYASEMSKKNNAKTPMKT